MARSARRLNISVFLLVALAHGSLAKSAEVLKLEAAPQATGLLLPTGSTPGEAGPGLVSIPTAATDPMSAKPLPMAGFPALPTVQPAATAAQSAATAALPGALPATGALPAFPAAQPALPAAQPAFPAAQPAFPAPQPAFPAAQPGFPAASGLPPLMPSFPAAAAATPLMPAAPMPTLPVAAFPTTLPGDGVMGRGGPAALPGLTAAGSASSKEMVGGSNFDSVFGSSVNSLGMGSSMVDPFAGAAGSLSMAGAGTLGASGTLGGSGALGGSSDGMAAALRQRRAQSSAYSPKVGAGVITLVAMAAVAVL